MPPQPRNVLRLRQQSVTAIIIRRTWVEELTDRQRTALEVAYFAGFFEWSRHGSGEEVDRTLSITPPTFHQHIRSAEKELFRALFEGESDRS